jgi:putative ATP-binding cassette transporter
MNRASHEAQGRGLFPEIFRLLRPFWLVTLLATAAGGLSGLATAWLLATINEGLHAADGLGAGLLLRFAALCALSVGCSALAGVGNSITGQKVIAALRKEISARVLRAPLALIERHRTHKILAVLTEDVDTVSAFTFNFAGYAVACAIAAGSFLYLSFLSPGVFLLCIAAIALGVAVNLASNRTWHRDYEGVRDAQDELQKQYRAIAEGAKELRLNRDRRKQVHGLLLAGAADRISSLKIHAMRVFWVADAAGAAIFFVVIGLLLAVQHRLDIAGATISGAVLVLLYVKGPVDMLISALPAMSQAQVAFKRIAALTADFREPEAALAATDPVDGTIRSIALRDARYVFPDDGTGNSFVLGPVDLTIHRGEALFIVGENGSGKTTLIKLLLGLYMPTAGALLFNDVPIGENQLDAYRQLFSAVFSDYYLFDNLLSRDPALTERANGYLERLEIAHKVRVEEGAFTTTDLSTGQRKRLALVHAYLEQRPIMMFDEWASDQDPTFRRVFYTELLPDLKRQGKTLIVISHDDRYFDAADRVVRLHAGRIVEVKEMNIARASGPNVVKEATR